MTSALLFGIITGVLCGLVIGYVLDDWTFHRKHKDSRWYKEMNGE